MKQLFNIFRIDEQDAERIRNAPDDPHSHEHEELIIGMKGGIDHFIDFQETRLQSPFISFVSKGKMHRVIPYVTNGQCDMWVIRFKSEFIPETIFQLYSDYHDFANIRMQEARCYERMVQLCQIMQDEMEQEDPEMGIVRHLLSALFSMIEAERKKVTEPPLIAGSTQNQTFKNFLKVLEENYKRPEGVEFYADKLFMSSRNLNIICKNILNRSVSEIIETRKLTEAKNMLLHSDKTVAEIGFELGYNEKAYFSNVFKRKSGQTPTEFREEMQKVISGSYN